MDEHNPGYVAYLAILKNELVNDPTAVGYGEMSHAECAAAINTVGLKPSWVKDRVTALAPTHKLLACIAAGAETTAFVALGAVRMTLFTAICACGQINVLDPRTRDLIVSIFAPGATFPLTLAALNTLATKEPAARWEMIEGGTPVGPHDVARARALP